MGQITFLRVKDKKELRKDKSPLLLKLILKLLDKKGNEV